MYVYHVHHLWLACMHANLCQLVQLRQMVVSSFMMAPSGVPIQWTKHGEVTFLYFKSVCLIFPPLRLKQPESTTGFAVIWLSGHEWQITGHPLGNMIFWTKLHDTAINLNIMEAQDYLVKSHDLSAPSCQASSYALVAEHGEHSVGPISILWETIGSYGAWFRCGAQQEKPLSVWKDNGGSSRG